MLYVVTCYNKPCYKEVPVYFLNMCSYFCYKMVQLWDIFPMHLWFVRWVYCRNGSCVSCQQWLSKGQMIKNGQNHHFFIIRRNLGFVVWHQVSWILRLSFNWYQFNTQCFLDALYNKIESKHYNLFWAAFLHTLIVKHFDILVIKNISDNVKAFKHCLLKMVVIFTLLAMCEELRLNIGGFPSTEVQ